VSTLDDTRQACSTQLDWQIPRAAEFTGYYEGEPAIIALLDTQERQVFRRFLDESQANWCSLVVNAVAERLQVVGFHFGDSSDHAWLIWQANEMDADSQLTHIDGLVCGGAYVLVQADEANPTGVSITAESPFEATVLYAPGNRRQRIAGYKRFLDLASQQTTEVLILPDQIATWHPGTTQPEVAPNPAGVVSLIEVRPQPRTVGPPRSELESAIPIQDRIHTTIFNRCVATDYGAFRQVWATGVKLARQIITDPEGGETTILVQPYNVGANRLLTNENPDGKFGSFPGDPLAGYIAAMTADIESLASITQTPPYYFTLGTRMVNLSADAIKASEAGLVAKVSNRALHIGEAWETVMRLALALTGDPGATDVEAEVIWKDFETRSEAQRVDALVKMGALGVPREVLWAKWGASPQEIEEWKAMDKANPPPPVVLPPGETTAALTAEPGVQAEPADAQP
jgi:hypothetical protein